MTDDYDVTTPEHLAWVKGLDYGAACEWRDSTDLPWVKGNVMNPPACALRPELIRPTAAERQRMARVDAMGYPPPPNAVIAVAKLQTALDALQIAHDEWRDRALRAEALVQRLETPNVPEIPDSSDDCGRGLLTMAAVSKGVGR